MGLTVIQLNEPLPFALKHFWVYPTREGNRGQLEIFDIVKARNADCELATVWRTPPYIEDKWAVAFIDVGENLDDPDEPKTYKMAKDKDGQPIIFENEVKAIQWTIKELFIKAL